ncbi:hypothetical protein OG205_10765 [Lentzea sp. NBC_00516]|uniref:hypothetical protein n=1 Tax=Lentzea sp. NBC_00516 TaxID=2903582 RepID=UPI002E802EE2|nr:hypothetical protein [Lentzea sp. NBC_00516]WUD27445.1 hypothetical protein OG205_10765 [Lentzea sp. NBC_00516]
MVHTKPAVMTAADFLAATGGVPFVDLDLGHSTLLTAVAAVRRAADPAAFPKLADYLDPAKAQTIFDRHARCHVDVAEYTEFSEAQEERIEQATAEVLTAVPEWTPLFQIPLRFRRMVDDRLSATSALVPQTIYLGDRAFDNATVTLAESLVHEHAHVWLNFVAEAFDLQREGASVNYVLPSGTGGKALRGVLFAAHFAAAAITLHSRTGGRPERLAYLVDYLGGCLATSAGKPDLTEMGALVHARLTKFLDEVR